MENKILLRTKRSLWLPLIALLLLISSVVGNAQETQTEYNPVVTTNKLDYAPGETALISGTGWEENGLIEIVIYCTYLPEIYEYFAFTDANGDFENVEFPIYEKHLGEEFHLIAEDAIGNSAEWFFTDGNVAFGQNNVPGNDNMTVTVTYTNSKSNSVVTETLTFKANTTQSVGVEENTTITWEYHPITIDGITYNWDGTSNYTQPFNVGTSNWTGTSAVRGNYVAEGDDGSGGLTITAPECAQGGGFTITCTPANGSEITDNTKTTPFSFTAKKNTSYTITPVETYNGNTYTGPATVTGTTPNENDYTLPIILSYTDTQNPTVAAADDVVTTTSADAAGDCDVEVAISDATFGDNCTGSTLAWVMTGDVTDSGNGQVGSYTFPTGITTITYTVTDATGLTATDYMTVTVTDDEDPVLTLPEVAASYTADQGLCLDELSFTATATDNCTVASIVYSVDDEDITFPYNFQVGSTTVDVLVTDVNGNTDEDSFDVIVTDDEDPVVLTQNITVQLDENGAATIDVDDIDNGSSDNCGIATRTLDITSFDCDDVGDVTVTLTVTDIYGNSASKEATVTVINDLPQTTSDIDGPIDPIQVGNSFDLYAEYNDVNLASATWFFSSDGENYDEGTPGTIDFDNMTVTGNFNLETNVYTAKLIITDVCGEQAEALYQYVVIYDPDGGFITGGGWIYSEAGALSTDLSAEGKANFGFVAKYKPGKNSVGEVDGNTNFQFRNGDIHFKSSSHEDMSLVISGQKATYKGEGTVNGRGNHKFLVSAIDGDVGGGSSVDRFRIKIYADNSSSDVLYDNQMDASDNADATTELGGGSIVIHTKKTKSAEISLPDSPAEVLTSHFNAYPNPFADRLRIEFVPAADNRARIDLYDMTGRLVQTVFDQQVEAGVMYNAEFKPETEVGGTYIYRMVLGEALQHGRVIYAK